jgi:glycosyltransferase 2 family protein
MKLLSYRWLSVVTACLLTVVLLIWSFRDISVSTVWFTLGKAKLGWLGLGLVSYLASFVFRAWRWGTLLSTKQDPGHFHVRQSAIFIGFAGNAILPASAGDMIRAGLLNRFTQISLGVVIGSIAAERLLDAVVALILLLTNLPIHIGSESTQLEQLPILWISLIVMLTSGAFLVAANCPDTIAQLVGRIITHLGFGKNKSRIMGVVRSLLSGLDALRKPRHVILSVVQTFLIWGLTALAYFAGFLAFDISQPGLNGAVFLQSMVALAIALPSSPGAVGPFEAAVRFSLEFYAVSSNTIIAYALMMRMLMLFGLMSMTSLCVMRLGLSRGDLKRSIASSTD